MSSRSADRTSSGIAGVAAPALGVSGAYIYGYDPAGNPTLTDPGYQYSADAKLTG